MRSSPLKRSSKGLRRSRRKKRTEAEEIAHDEFVEAARRQRVCAVSGKGGLFDPHHVVEQQWLKQNGLPLDDKRNALRLNPDIHANHTTKMTKVPMRCLTDDNFEYAFEVMGIKAVEYLARNYEGTDPRYERASQLAEDKWEAEHAD